MLDPISLGIGAAALAMWNRRKELTEKALEAKSRIPKVRLVVEKPQPSTPSTSNANSDATPQQAPSA